MGTTKLKVSRTLVLFLLMALALLATTWVWGGSLPSGAAESAGTQSPTVAVAQGSNWQIPAEDQVAVQVVKQAGPAVVTVVNKLAPSRSGVSDEALGSGIIVDLQGHIITNQHVIDGSATDGLSVIFANGDTVPAQLVGADSVSDLAVLKVSYPVTTAASFGNSDELLPGETVIAIGSALGDFRNTVTMGIVSGLNRTLPGAVGSDIEPMIQTDAAINHGNSGGPLIDLSGNVIGINTAVVTGAGDGSTDGQSDVAQGLGFAIPINTVKTITAQLVAQGNVPRPYLGVSSQPISPMISALYGLDDLNGKPLQNGALITGVAQGSPAAAAGIQEGDVITQVNGTAVDDTHPLVNILLNFKPGDTVALTIVRDSNALSLKVTLGTRPS